MDKLEKVITELEKEISDASIPDEPKGYMFPFKLISDALDLLKAQELPDVKPEKLEERTTKWLDNMTAEERLEEIAAILDDWDGYRTAKGLGELINEVWAYALYPVKAQEPRVLTLEEITKTDVVWLECYGICSNLFKAALPKHPLNINDSTWDFQTHPYTETMFLAEYGKNWRCWTSKPTDEQRKATPWTS